MKLEFSWHIFENFWNIKFHENPYSGSRVVPYGPTDITKLIVAFRNSKNVPKKYNVSSRRIHEVLLTAVTSHNVSAKFPSLFTTK
jgi:hypothetical protein